MSFVDKINIERIGEIATLLHLFAHRNKNQHRRSIWWRHFSTFRRQVNAIEHDLRRLSAVPSTHVERAKLNSKAPTIRFQIEQRVQSWPVSKWQHAFSQLVADGRFAQLGLVLQAMLAQVCMLTQTTSQLEALGEIEVQQALDDFGREHWKDEDSLEDFGAVVARSERSEQPLVHLRAVVPRSQKDERSLGDLGAAVPRSRNDRHVTQDLEAEAHDAAAMKPPTRTKVKKKKSKANAIDELFGGL